MGLFQPNNEDEVKLAVDSLSLQYYEYILKPWLKTWSEGEKPQVMTEKELVQEEDEIRASVATMQSQQDKETKIKAGRLPKEMKDLKRHPVEGVTLMQSDVMSCTVVVEGP